MQKPSIDEIIVALLDSHGKTYAERIGIAVPGGDKVALFRLLAASLLFTDRIGWEVALRAAGFINEQGLLTPQQFQQVGAGRLRDVLNDAGFTLFDMNETYAQYLVDLARDVNERYNGDINNLRSRVAADTGKERTLLQEFRGIGDISADFFFREVQPVWDEWYPYLDGMARSGARELGLPDDVQLLSRSVPRNRFAAFAASLAAVASEKSADKVLQKAGRKITV